LRLVRRHMGRRLDFNRVRIAPSVMPVTGSFCPLVVVMVNKG